MLNTSVSAFDPFQKSQTLCQSRPVVVSEGVMAGRIITAIVAIAASTGVAFAEPLSEQGSLLRPLESTEPSGALRGVVHRIEMRVTQLHVDADDAEVERVLDRPTTVSQGWRDDTKVLFYANEPLRTSVTITRGHVTAIELDVLYVDSAVLPRRARMVKPSMVRAGVLAVLGNPNADDRWTASGIEIEQLFYKGADASEFSVFLADGRVADVKPGAETPSDIAQIILPLAIPDGLVGTALSIGLNPKQAASLLGSPAWTPATSTLKGQPAEYATFNTLNKDRLISLTFVGGTLTSFSEWLINAKVDCGDTCPPR